MSTRTASPLPADLADYTASRRMILLGGLAIVVGAASALLAVALLDLIGFFTNLFFYQRLSSSFSSPSGHHLGLWGILVPPAGAFIVGLMARYGSDKIRGHGIPEALEAILLRGSRVEPKVALLKPLSAAISIGSGGPFGAEGPIIMTGGAFGSTIAQTLHMTAAERKSLLVAGAAAGMSATFGAPMASVLLALELLLFELKPRSLVPVALASATAMFVRVPLLGAGPIFSVPLAIVAPVGASAEQVGYAAVLGLVAGALASLMSTSVYAAEDWFGRLPIHWMWWPVIGGSVVGIGGFLCPRALGVGYDTIQSLLNGQLGLREVALLVAVKWVIWAMFLGSGTSGGVLAPLFMIGAAVGGLVGHEFPGTSTALWPLIMMGATFSAAMGAPLTAVLFAAEVTGRFDAMLPLLAASAVAHGFSVLVMRRSILTEKIARRGYHLTREYAIDSLDVLFVRDVMDAPPLSPDELDEGPQSVPFSSLPFAHPDELLSRAVRRMAETGHTRLRVIGRTGSELLGVVTLDHTLMARQRHLEEEERRERVLRVTDIMGFAMRLGRPVPRPLEPNSTPSEER